MFMKQYITIYIIFLFISNINHYFFDQLFQEMNYLEGVNRFPFFNQVDFETFMLSKETI